MPTPAETVSDPLSAVVAGLRGVSGPVRLAALVRVRELVEEQIAEEVGRLSRRHYSWQAIGDLLGVSRQAAHKRYAGGAS